MRRFTTVVIGVAALATTATLTTAAFPLSANAGPSSVGAPIPSASKSAGKTTTLTLITGDKLEVSTDPSGRITVAPLSAGPFITRFVNGDHFVLPVSAIPALSKNRLDEKFFNVSELMRQGYDDARTKSIPVIATYAGTSKRSAHSAPPGMKTSRDLASIDALALNAPKSQSAVFWRTEKTKLGSSTSDGTTPKKLWLDRKASSLLDKSAAQIGAPAAWQQGFDGTGTKVAVLDSGIDAEHPDLVGKVAMSADFTGEGEGDGNGHGTHVASTVAGTGAASGGAKKGVAPGAKLLVGKVLGADGSGAYSWIIDGIEWAVANDADVVSMSLGSKDVDNCGDPLAQAITEAAKGRLFVIAAGNNGPTAGSVSTPACVPDVLTVGAVDRDDTVASFSSRGFTTTNRVKPEIAAPGVGISAARAGGRGDLAYRSGSGTSMATPHVAGAAAILLQQHPDWTAQQLKSALTGSAKVTAGRITEVGAGRLAVDQAVQAKVFTDSVVNAGFLDWPQTSTKTIQVTYRNTSDEPVNLSLASRGFIGNDGRPAPVGLVRLEGPTVTVPARGATTVPVVIDPTVTIPAAQYGAFGGRIVATMPDGRTITTVVDFYLQPKTVNVTLQVTARNGLAPEIATFELTSLEPAAITRTYLVASNTKTVALRAGTYSIGGFVTSYDEGGSRRGLAETTTLLSYPQIDLTDDTTVVLDARKAHRIRPVGRQPLAVTGSALGFGRWWTDNPDEGSSGHGSWVQSSSYLDAGSLNAWYGWTSGTATRGNFEVNSYWRMGKPLLSLRVDGPSGFPIEARYSGSVFAVDPLSRFQGSGRAQLVDAGKGTAEEFAAANARGKIALVETDAEWAAESIANTARAAGAVGVLLHRPTPGRWSSGTHNVLPMATITAATAAKLKAARPITLAWKGTRYSDVAYNLGFVDKSVQQNRNYWIDESRLARVDTNLHRVGDQVQTTDFQWVARPWNPTSFQAVGLSERVPIPGQRTDYYSTGIGQWRHSVDSAPRGFPMNRFARYDRAGSREREDWFKGVLRPAAGRSFDDGTLEVVGVRQENVIAADFTKGIWGDSEAAHWGPGNLITSAGSVELFEDGRSLGAADSIAGGWYVSPDLATYELKLKTQSGRQPSPSWDLSTSTETSFRFSSQASPDKSTPLPLLFPSYDIRLDRNNTIEADDTMLSLSASGTGGYQAGRIIAAKLSYSYDQGATWRAAHTRLLDGKWRAFLDHASKKAVSLKVELADSKGASVTQTVVDAYRVR